MIIGIAFFASPVCRFVIFEDPDANEIIIRNRHAHCPQAAACCPSC